MEGVDLLPLAAPMTTLLAKGLFRALVLAPLGIGNLHVDSDPQEITSARAPSPILLVPVPDPGRAVIAEGDHRTCAGCSVDENAAILCTIG